MTTGPEPAVHAVCSNCGRAVRGTDNFCEACRTELAPTVASSDASATATDCVFCHAEQITADGYCESCGRKVPTGRDHVELDLGLLAGVTDKGLRRARNEDAMALATAESASGPAVLAVVCDGVSSSPRPDEASLTAVQTAVRVLLAGVRAGEDLAETSHAAVAAVQLALAGLDEPGLGNAPAATFVSAVMTSETVMLCWLGDSRAYWLGSGTSSDAKRLTRDDSVAGEMVAAGLVSEANAMALPGAHVVTGWVGADSPGGPPHVAMFTPPGPGVLLLCSDGLWNYQAEAARLAGLALPAALSDPLGTAAALVKFAVEAGGADNITVVLAPFPLAAPKPEEKPADRH
jgi:serine/threonine protein phosphatase PrpC